VLKNTEVQVLPCSNRVQKAYIDLRNHSRASYFALRISTHQMSRPASPLQATRATMKTNQCNPEWVVCHYLWKSFVRSLVLENSGQRHLVRGLWFAIRRLHHPIKLLLFVLSREHSKVHMPRTASTRVFPSRWRTGRREDVLR